MLNDKISYKIINNKEKIIFTILILAILLIRLWNIGELSGPYVFDDEMGYWSHAANLSGLSWRETNHAWYSYGYSFLLLPLFLITHNMNYLYRMAITENAILGVIGFVLGKCIVKEIDEECNEIIAMFISFVGTCYSAYTFQSNIAWSETLIYTWFVLILYGMIRFCKNTSICRMCVLTVEIYFLYVIHNRCIVVCIAYFLTLAYMAFRRKVKWQYVLCAAVIFMSLSVGNGLMRSQLELMNGLNFGGNDMNSQNEKMKLFLSLDGWKTLCQSLIGKMWYILSSTLMLGYFGGIFIIKKFVLTIKKENDLDVMNPFYFFIGTIVCGVIAITTIVAIPQINYLSSTRLDVFFYGRYSDIISGILIILGLLYIYKSVRFPRIWGEWGIGLVIYSLVSWGLYEQIKNISTFYVNILCVPGVYFEESFVFSRVIYAVLISCFGIAVFTIIAKAIKRKNGKVNAYLMIFISMIYMTCFTCVGVNAYSSDIFQNQKNVRSYANICDLLNANSEYDIYYMSNLIHRNKQMIRTQVVEGKIYYNQDEIQSENYFVIYEWDVIKDKRELVEEYQFVMAEENSLLVFAHGENLINDLVSQGYECYDMRAYDIKFLDEQNVLDVSLEFANPKDELHELNINERRDWYIDIVLKCRENTLLLNNENYKLAYRIYKADAPKYFYDGNRVEFVNLNGGTGTEISLLVDADKFSEAGAWVVEIGFLQEGKMWCSAIGAEVLNVYVDVVNETIRTIYDISQKDVYATGVGELEMEEFVWTTNESVDVICFLEKDDYHVLIYLGPEIPLENIGFSEYPIEVLVNGEYVDEITIDTDNNGKILEFDITEEEMEDGKNVISFESVLWSPADYGSADTRQLGFSFSTLKFENAE